MGLAQGDAHTDDLWVANSRYRGVIRHPLASLTLAGLGGGTVIDLAPWGFADGLHEAAPLVGGGWLDIDQAEILDDGLRLAGTVVSLPDRPAAAVGSAAEVTWRFAPDSDWIELEGADGLWLHPSGEHEVLDGWVWSGNGPVYGHDGEVEEDLGGALRIVGLTRLLVTDPAGALAARANGVSQHISGSAPGATRLEFARDGVPLGWLGLSEGVFDAEIPADVDQVRAAGAFEAPSAWVRPDEELELALGGTGAFELRPAWSTHRNHRLRIDWTATDGRTGVAHLPGRGGTLFLGRGEYRLLVSAGPSFWPADVLVEVEPNFKPTIGVGMVERYDPGPRALGALGWPTDRSRTWRGKASTAATLAHGLGHDWVMFAPEDDVAASADSATSFPPIDHANGSHTLARDVSWSILTWPWAEDPAKPGRGAVDVTGLSPEDALAAAIAGQWDRHSVVDLGWLAQVGSPWAVAPRPEGVLLTAPGPEGPTAWWGPWFRWLDAGVPIAPTGRSTWFDVADPGSVTTQDIAQALVSGRTIATTGPLLELEVLGATPEGGAAGPEVMASVALHGAEEVDKVALIGEGGAVLDTWFPSQDHWSAAVQITPGRWLVAVAWDEAGTAFAATAPVWIEPPGAPD